MGWFSKKRIYMQSLSFQKMKGEAFEEYKQVKKDIAFGLDGHLERFPEEIWKYKHDSKLRFNRKRLEELGAIPTTSDISSVDLDPLWTAVSDQVTDLVEILDIEDKNKIVNGEEYLNPLLYALVEEFMTRDNYKPYLHYDGAGKFWFYSNSSSSTLESVTIWKSESESINSANTELTLNYTEIEYDSGGGEVDSSSGSKTWDCTEYYYAKAYYLAEDDITNDTRFVYIDRVFFVSPSQPVSIDSFQFAPILNMKTDNEILGSCQYNNSCTAEQLKEVKLRKKVVRDLGTDMEAVHSLMDSGSIDHFSIGLALSPSDIMRSSAVAKYFYHFFDLFGGESALSGPRYVWARNREIEVTTGNVEATFGFNLTEEVFSGPIPILLGFGEYKVRLKQKTLNSVIYVDAIEKVYEDYIDAGETGMVSQYEAVVAQYKIDTADGTNPDSSSYKDAVEAYNALPPSDYNSTKMGKKTTYAYCHPDDFDKILFHELNYNIAEGDDEPDWIELYEVHSYTPFRTTSSEDYEKLYVEFDDSKTRRVSVDGKSATEETMIEIKIFKQVDSSNYKVFTYDSGLIDYEVDGHEATVNHISLESKFRIFMLDDYMDSLKYKEYVAIYDRSLCGMSFVQEVTVLKWYERPSFLHILRAVAIIVTVFSIDAGSGIGAIAVSIAEGIAIAAIAQAIAKEIGGTTGVILGVIAAVAMYYYVGGVDAGESSSLWLKSADMYMKLQSIKVAEDTAALNREFEKFKREYKSKMIMLKTSMEKYDTMGYSRDAIIENIANQSYYNGDSDILFDVKMLDKIGEAGDKLPDVAPVDHNLVETLYNRVVDIPIEVYEFEHVMQKIDEFGDNSQIK